MRAGTLLVGLCFLSSVVGLSAAPAAAQSTGFGAGFLFGEPAGVNAKLWRGGNTAVVGGLAWSFVDDGALDAYADYVWHQYGIFTPRRGQLPLYVGIGGRLLLDNDSRFGIRTVFGIDYLFDTAPVDLFVEIVPLLDIAPKTEWEFNGAFGVRYFFR